MTKKKPSENLARPINKDAWGRQIDKERIAPYDFPIRNRFMEGTIYDGKELEYRGKQPRKAMA